MLCNVRAGLCVEVGMRKSVTKNVTIFYHKD